MNEQRLQAYNDLINALLTCRSDEEAEARLNAHIDLVDAKLLQLMQVAAASVAQQGHASAADFLRNVAAQLEKQIYLNFLWELLQATKDSDCNYQIVYPILQQNLDKLNDNLARILREWATDKLTQVDLDTAQNIASDIGNLSNLIQEFPLGTIEDNRKIAITGYEIILTVFTPHTSSENWAGVQTNLANAYLYRIQGGREEDLEQSIDVLKVRKQTLSLEPWAMDKNRETAYINRMQEEREENLKKAIAASEAALTVYTESAFPQQWAATQFNLAIAYLGRVLGNREDHLEKAIAASEAALKVYTKSAFPEQWATTQSNLATAYRNRIREDREENLEKAISAYQEVLKFYAELLFSEQWARNQNNLERSLLYEQWAGNKNNLALTYSKRIRGNRGENLEEAIAAYEAALIVYTPNTYPINCIKTGRNLGNLGLRENLWDKALFGYDAAIRAVEQSLEWVTSEKRKRQLRASAIDVYENMVRACINGKQLDRAVETVERSKSRQLVELLVNANLYPKNASKAQQERLKELRNWLASMSWLLEEIATETSTATTSNLSRDYIETQKQQLQEARRQLNQLLDEIKQQDPEFTLTQRVEPISFAGIRTLINSETAILDWYTGTSGFYAFIITQNTLDIVEFSLSELQQLEAWLEDYFTDYGDTTWEGNLADRVASLSQILRLDEIVAKISPSCKELILIPHRYLHLLPLHACEVSSSRCANLEIYPCRLIDCFPAGIRYAPNCQLLQLVQRKIQESAGIPQPTENLLLNRSLFAIQNPSQNLHYTDVEVETIQRNFAPPPDTQILIKEAATKFTFMQNLATLRKAQYAHFSCHGAFNFEFPLLSSLHLADTPQQPTPEKDSRQLTLRNGRKANPEKSLTLQEIFASVDLPRCRLVTLSACETGLTDATKLVDEYIGLPSGFLYAGSPSVVSSLWSVDELATAILMIKFYEELRTESNISLALKKAQYWMRTISREDFLNWMKNSLKLNKESSQYIQFWIDCSSSNQPFSAPQYWAAFCAIGK